MPSLAWQLGSPQVLACCFYSFLLLLLIFSLIDVPWGQAGACTCHPLGSQAGKEPSQGLVQLSRRRAQQHRNSSSMDFFLDNPPVLGDAGRLRLKQRLWAAHMPALLERTSLQGSWCLHTLHMCNHECNTPGFDAN